MGLGMALVDEPLRQSGLFVEVPQVGRDLVVAEVRVGGRLGRRIYACSVHRLGPVRTASGPTDRVPRGSWQAPRIRQARRTGASRSPAHRARNRAGSGPVHRRTRFNRPLLRCARSFRDALNFATVVRRLSDFSKQMLQGTPRSGLGAANQQILGYLLQRFDLGIGNVDRGRRPRGRRGALREYPSVHALNSTTSTGC